MNNAELLAKIKAEIKRLQATNPSEYNYDNAVGYMWALNDILSFLSTLESEKPINQEEVEVELDIWRHIHFNGARDGHFSGEYLERTSQLDLARHFAQWGAEHLADARKISLRDLKEAANNYLDGIYGKMPHSDYHIEIFIAGAKLGAEHTTLPEDTVLFNKGVAEGKRLMMEDAIVDRRQIAFMIEDARRCGVIEGRKQVLDDPGKYGLQELED